MGDRGARMFVLGLIIGGLSVAVLAGSAVAAWKWRSGATLQGRDVAATVVKPVQGLPLTPREVNPREFAPLFPPRGPDQGPGTQGPGTPSPGAGGQDCDKILYFFQGKLYQLRPGPMPRNGGNPEFYYMQPYQGPQIPGFPAPGPMGPGMPDPNMGPAAPRRI
jgi:hypothetical protein